MQNIDGNQSSWYALRIVSKFARVASMTLEDRGYEAFLPAYAVTRQWSDRVKKMDEPLFPGYMFCRFDVRDRLLPILTTPGVISIIGAGKTPVAIPDHEIASIQTIVKSGLPARPCPMLAEGTKVLIERGPLAGVEGIVLQVEKSHRVVVSVSLLQRSVAVEIDHSWARALPSPMLVMSAPSACAMQAVRSN